MNKKLLLKVVMFIFSCVLIVTMFILYFKSLKITTNIINDIKVEISLNRRFRSCKVLSVINNSNYDKETEEILENDNYIKKDNKYIKNITINSTCDSIYKKYKNDKIAFKLKGKKNLNIEVNSEYEDDGYSMTSSNGNVKLIKNINTGILGKQYVVYELKTNLYNKYLIRTINVIDTAKPSISLKGNECVTIYLGSKYNEPGFTANDNYDGDITDKVEVTNTINSSKEGNYEVNYKVSDSSGNITETKRTIIVKKSTPITSGISYSDTEATGLTYIKGILVVNKKYGLPKDYNPGVNPEAQAALQKMQAAASILGLNLRLVSGYRSYTTQYNLYNNYVKINGQAKADTFSARPGHSEHQTGLAFDVGSTKGAFANTSESKWLEQNCHLYGFIIRYPKGKTNITGYIYEPWHVRYLGVETATKVKNSGLTLEEYLGIN